VQVERAVGAMVHPAVRGHALVAEVALQVPRRVRRLQEQLEGEGVERNLKHRSHMKSRFA
jgi:hypothetical protein